MRRILTRTSQVLTDFTVLSVAYLFAFLLRFEGWPPFWMFKSWLLTWPYVVGFQYLVLAAHGVPRFAWSYVGLREVRRIALALGLASLGLGVVRVAAGRLWQLHYFFEYAIIPFGVIIIDFTLALLGTAGVRVLRRIQTERAALLHGAPRKSRAPAAQATLLIGAGQAGVSVAREVAKHPELGITLAGFIDDDILKVGMIVEGLPVLGSTAQIGVIASGLAVKQAIITIARADGKQIRRIQQICADNDIAVKIVPGVHEILDGKVNLSRIREVSIEDLLGRDAVHLEIDLVERFIRGRRVLVTGAGGSIGSELCRQVANLAPEALVLVERSEYHLFLIHQELLEAFPGLEIVPAICDVGDLERLDAVFSERSPHVVIHAAAHKHVPMMEWNPGEAVKNNVFGTKAVADAADRHGAEAFVLISTDKAVNPSSIMGATKRVAEMYVQALSQRSKTKYVAVRFGNVLGSAGSVIPIFKAQIAKGGPVTVTHPDMKRYFMTIPEASQLVLQAAAMGRGGEIFVLDMGEPVKIVDLARDLIRLSGFVVDEDIRINFSGMRPGEKLFEELGFDAEKMRKTRHEKIFDGTMVPRDWDAMATALGLLREATHKPSRDTVRAALRAVVPEMVSVEPDAPLAPPVPASVAADADAAQPLADAGLRPSHVVSASG
jgi:FlaA1/EpsC-like NDP-sugar epimerase